MFGATDNVDVLGWILPKKTSLTFSFIYSSPMHLWCQARRKPVTYNVEFSARYIHNTSLSTTAIQFHAPNILLIPSLIEIVVFANQCACACGTCYTKVAGGRGLKNNPFVTTVPSFLQCCMFNFWYANGGSGPIVCRLVGLPHWVNTLVTTMNHVPLFPRLLAE